MIASFKHKLIYVKGRKVGSTSIEMALAPFCGSCDIVTPITPADEFERISNGGKCQNYCKDSRLEIKYLTLIEAKKFKAALRTKVHSPKVSDYYNHMPLEEIERRLKIPLDQYTLVISERSPYAKIVSLANMQLSFRDYVGDVMENSIHAVKQRIGALISSGEIRLVRNIDLYRTRQIYRETILLRQESLETDLETLFLRFGLGNGPKSWPHAKKGILSHNLDPQAMFTREQLDCVNEEFSAEFEQFGYDKI